MSFVEPESLFDGVVLVAAPHMDDEVLACGGTLASLSNKERAHVVYATDGAESPVPPLAWIGRRSADLPAIRRAEARRALETLGVPPSNAHFLDLPDGALQARLAPLVERLAEILGRVRPDHLFIPFRFDRHPDHLALHRAALVALAASGLAPEVFEYFVYFRSRLVPGGDLRRHVRPDALVRVAIDSVSGRKMDALRCYASQTQRYFDWQARPILTARSLEESCSRPEQFVRYHPALPGGRIFARLAPWIAIAQAVEPPLKRVKDLTGEILRRTLSRGSRHQS